MGSGAPSDLNCHPTAPATAEFIVVHNGIITNQGSSRCSRDQGMKFESETDTECIAKLIKHIRSQNTNDTLRQLVEEDHRPAEGASPACSSPPSLGSASPGGLPLLVGIKAESALESDSIPVQYPEEDPKVVRHGTDVLNNSGLNNSGFHRHLGRKLQPCSGWTTTGRARRFTP